MAKKKKSAAFLARNASGTVASCRTHKLHNVQVSIGLCAFHSYFLYAFGLPRIRLFIPLGPLATLTGEAWRGTVNGLAGHNFVLTYRKDGGKGGGGRCVDGLCACPRALSPPPGPALRQTVECAHETGRGRGR
uniref:Uncharacterized protein n=1 Tax=Pristionchus pacificus TaxID=54126 RepID=A0A2A6CVG2_PRIPA|eukprot:PDM82037.1 hypothetical protein PRIPAC_36430 [Pristionchus pacificus]